MLEIQKKYGLILKGANIILNDFTFEKPFAAFGNNMFVKAIGGGYSYVGANTILRDTTLGRYCSIGDNCCVGIGRHALEWASTASMTSTSFMFGELCSYGNFDGKIEPCEQMSWWPQHSQIGHDVWFGTGVFLPGAKPVNIGTGAVIGGKSVVTKDVPPYAVAAGNPARVVKMRFSDEIIADLLESKWWDYDLNYFYAKTGIKIPISDVKGFLSFLKDYKELLEKHKMNEQLQKATCDGKSLSIINV